MEKTSSTPPQDDEGLVIIPWNYEQERVVPIYIRTVDVEGRRVHRGWIDAVRPITDPLRALAKRVIGEEWQVAELAEGSVHALNKKYGETVGRCPEAQVWADATWRVQDIAAGSRRARSCRDVELKDYVLDHLAAPHNLQQAYEDKELLELLRQELLRRGNADLLVMLNMHMTGAKDLIPEVFGVEPNSRARNTLSQQWSRGMRGALMSIQKRMKRR